MCPRSLSQTNALVLLSVLLLAWFSPSCQGAISKSTKQRSTNNEPSPVLLIPGFGGAQSYAIDGHETQAHREWLGVKTFFKINDFVNNYKLLYNITTRTTHDVHNRINIFSGFGKTWASNLLGSPMGYRIMYFGDLVERLMMHPFYIDGTTLASVIFDYRRAPNENRLLLVQMKHLIEKMYVKSGNRRVVIVTHSMGGLYGLLFLNNMTAQWKQKYVRAFVPASAPWSGSAKALRIIVHGEDFNIFFVNAKQMRIATSTMPSAYFLLPKHPTWSKDEILLSVGNKYIFTINNISSLFTRTGNHPGFNMYLDTRNLLNGTVGPTDVDEIYCIYSVGSPTYSRFNYPDVGQNLTKIFDLVPEDIMEDGDGSVPWRSLRVCEDWQNIKRIRRILNSEHVAILSDKRFLDEIENIILAGDQRQQNNTIHR